MQILPYHQTAKRHILFCFIIFLNAHKRVVKNWFYLIKIEILFLFKKNKFIYLPCLFKMIILYKKCIY